VYLLRCVNGLKRGNDTPINSTNTVDGRYG
jgi:hypothetical protein